MFIAFSSGGNDSVAVIQTMIEMELPKQARCLVAYNDTGWAAPYWKERVDQVTAWCRKHDIHHHTIPSVGFLNMVRRESGGPDAPRGRFPSGKQKFCTRKLKIEPTEKWLSLVDPSVSAICLVGKRRAESEQRKHTPPFIPFSRDHGGRHVWHPLVEMSNDERNAVVLRSPMPLLDHRSDECEPCIFSGRADLRRVTPEKVDQIRDAEADTGKTMFRPRAYAGAVGIDEVMRWAWSERGQYRPEDASLEQAILDDGKGDCESGWCGS